MAVLISKLSIGKQDVWGKPAFLIFNAFTPDIYFLPPSLIISIISLAPFPLSTSFAFISVYIYTNLFIPSSALLIRHSGTRAAIFLPLDSWVVFFLCFLSNTPSRAQLAGALHVRTHNFITIFISYLSSDIYHCLSFLLSLPALSQAGAKFRQMEGTDPSIIVDIEEVGWGGVAFVSLGYFL